MPIRPAAALQRDLHRSAIEAEDAPVELRMELRRLRWSAGGAPGPLHEPATLALLAPPEGRTWLERASKRLFDLVLTGAALVVLSPLLLLVAALVKLGSPGPVFFRQVRLGERGHPFEMLKFRSMVQDAEDQLRRIRELNERDGPVFKMRRDPRVTPLGRFLRKYSIDELPQLFNVLRGELSLVGPRPPIPAEVARYQPWQLKRLAVTPGLTCIWQVTPDRHQLSFEQWVRLDLEYIREWSLRGDLWLVLRTIPAVLAGRGQY